MKKTLALLMAAAMAFGLTACGGDQPAANNTDTPVATTAPAAEVTTEPAAVEPPAVAEGPEGYPQYTGDPVELRLAYWGNDDRVQRTDDVIALFESYYPSIKVTGEPAPGTNEMFDMVKTQLTAGNAADIIQMGGNFADFKEFIVPLQSYFGGELANVADPAAFDQTTFDIYSAGGDRLGVCVGKNLLALVYNKTLLESAGAPLPPATWTWEEMKAYGESVKALLPEGVYPFVDNAANQANYIAYWFRQLDKPVWTSDLQTFVDADGAKGWLDVWTGYIADGLVPDAETTGGYAETSPDTSALIAGKAAVGLIWANQIGAYQGATTDELGLTVLPTGGKPALATQGSQCFTINKTAASVEAAALFLNFFASHPEAAAILQTNRGIPSSIPALESLSASAEGADKILFDYSAFAAASGQTIPQDPNLPGDQEFIQELQRIYQAVQFGEATNDEGAQQIVELITRLAATG
ncbi:MAG: extracellular solute-binding protein [Clostridiales bacterium]|jgi:multiple sugar transport system substrate-binding protein|nr:extracellular solute-binding protein [Clostridiales bacterium]